MPPGHINSYGSSRAIHSKLLFDRKVVFEALYMGNGTWRGGGGDILTSVTSPQSHQ